MDTYEVVKKLIGYINPVGETKEDSERLENLRKMLEVVDRLIFDIEAVARQKNRQEHSIGKAGKLADKYLSDLTTALNDNDYGK
jgi:hypothetical protein